MDLKKLFQIQKELDEHIEQKHPRFDGEDRLSKKILSLLVELGELANEQRSWKFWSEDQEPRNFTKCWNCSGQENGYFSGYKWTGEKEDCIECLGTGINKTKNPLLEEYVDCLHFILSIGLQEYEYYKDNTLQIGWIRNHDPIKYENLIKQFNYMFQQIGYFYDCIAENEWGSKTEVEEQYEQTYRMFFGLGEMLGFTWKQIEQAYMSKNKVNYERLESGY